MGGTKPWPEVSIGNADHKSAAVVIIGAGVSGICMAIDLLKRNACQNFIILEKSSSVGGTWHDNKYPGCCCDVRSMLYSYSFEQNPNWTREYPGQEELLEYLVRTASKYNLFRHVRFNSSVTSAEWDESTKQWNTHVSIAAGSKDAEYETEYTISSDFLVSAVGQLNVPSYPNLEGLDKFQGRTLHSARWDWNYDLTGKRIALIGNGATAIQILPEIAKVAKHVTVHQRTANWIIPRLDMPVSETWKTLYRYVPPLAWRKRARHMGEQEDFWQILAPGSDYSNLVREWTSQMQMASFPDNEPMRKALTPSYNPGCKRVLISDDYYPALTRDNVQLETRTISKVTTNGVSVKNDGSDQDSNEEVDLIVLATGFRTVQFMYPIKIVGRNGRSIQDIWEDGARAYNGVSVEDLPNFGMMYGPNTNLGHNSIILMIEAQSRYINALVGAVLEARQTKLSGSNTLEKEGDLSGSRLSLSPKRSIVEAFNTELQESLSRTAFSDPACGSWYKDPRSGKITNNWSGTVVDYQQRLKSIKWEDYEDGEKVVSMRKGEQTTYVGYVQELARFSDRMLAGASLFTLAAAGVGLAWRNQKTVRSFFGAR